jgi:hypothetical protein
MRQYDDDDAFELIDGKKVLRDGRRLRVPLMFRDGVNPALTALQRSVASRHQLSDEELASCRPGFRYGRRSALDRQAMSDAKAEAYALYDAELRQKYLTPEGLGGDPRITGAGSRGAIGQREGDVCTVRGPEFASAFGSPGHLRMRNGQLVCVPDNARDISRSRSDAKARLRSPLDPDEDDDDEDDDDRSVAQAASDHQARMKLIYDELDRELEAESRNVKP